MKAIMKEPLLIVFLCFVSSELIKPFEPILRQIKEIKRQDREDMIWLTPEHYFK
jgi:hypothetical protein